MKRAAVGLALPLLAAFCGGRAHAEERRYALIVGYNGAPATVGSEPPAALQFADDDALAFYELMREQGARATLLASPDSASRRRYPSVDDALTPTLAQLDRAMSKIDADIRADAQAGRASTFFFFYSGHGSRGPDGQPSLTLLDGALSRAMLYERVLDRAPADAVHLLIDACHAESIVGSRDGAAAVALKSGDIATFFAQTTLDRYPHLGFAIASTRDGVSHEWDFYQSGIFSHEVISALRGAADINGDQRIEYSELGAFLSAANREVRDPRARLQAVVRAPAAAPRTPIVDWSHGTGVGRLTKIPTAPQSFSIEDDRGLRLVDGHPEIGFSMSISLPANRRLFVRRAEQEAEIVLQPGVDLPFRELAFRTATMRTRDALDSSLREGLFLAQFGPAYYRGYVDNADAVPVPAPDAGAFAEPGIGWRPPERKSPLVTWLGSASAAMVVSSGVFAGLAWGAWRDDDHAVERDSIDASRRFRTDITLSIGFALSAAACAGAALLVGNDL